MMRWKPERRFGLVDVAFRRPTNGAEASWQKVLASPRAPGGTCASKLESQVRPPCIYLIID